METRKVIYLVLSSACAPRKGFAGCGYSGITKSIAAEHIILIR